MYVLRNKVTGKFWKNILKEVDLQKAQLYPCKDSADYMALFYKKYKNKKLEVLEVEILDDKTRKIIEPIKISFELGTTNSIKVFKKINKKYGTRKKNNQ